MMMNDTVNAARPLVSVIVPMHQAAEYLRDCLDSVMTQSYKELEVLLIDDGSTDDTASIAEEYVRRDSRFQLLRRENGGLSAARNTGLDAAKGEWIAFCDSDDVMIKDGISTLVNAALASGTAMSMGAYVEVHPMKRFTIGRPVWAHAGVYRTADEVQKYFLTYGQFLCHMWTKLFRRDVFEGIRFPEGKIYEDNFILPHLLENAGSCAVVKNAVYRYIVRPGSLSTGSNVRRQMDGLQARLAYTEFMKLHHPELAGLAHDMTLAFCCDLMGKIEHVGIDNAKAEWEEVLATARAVLPEAALQNAVFRMGAAMFKKDPRLISRFIHWLLHADRMI